MSVQIIHYKPYCWQVWIHIIVLHLSYFYKYYLFQIAWYGKILENNFIKVPVPRNVCQKQTEKRSQSFIGRPITSWNKKKTFAWWDRNETFRYLHSSNFCVWIFLSIVSDTSTHKLCHFKICSDYDCILIHTFSGS